MFTDISKKPDVFSFRVEKKNVENITIFKNSSTLKIAKMDSSKKLENMYQKTWLHIQEDSNL
jgi:hypothetical protein